MGGTRSRRGARWGCVYIATILATVAYAGHCAPARAVDVSDLLAPDLAATDWTGGADAFAGMDVTDGSLFSYGGFTVAPSDLHRDGLRLRVYAGAGHYTYTAGIKVGSAAGDMHRRADVLQAEALLGWQVSTGPMVLRLFAGLAYEDQSTNLPDPSNAALGEHLGAKVAIETWFDLSSRLWLSADASYATTIDSYSGAAKLGLKPLSWISLGPEAAAFGNAEFDAHRLGGFARWHCGGCDVTVSGGVSGDYNDETGAYGALSFYTRF